MFGTRAADFVGKIENWMKNIHPDDLAPTLSTAERAIRDHTVYEAEYRVRRLDGTYGWVRVRGRATYDEHGEPVRLVASAGRTTSPGPPVTRSAAPCAT